MRHATTYIVLLAGVLNLLIFINLRDEWAHGVIGAVCLLIGLLHHYWSSDRDQRGA